MTTADYERLCRDIVEAAPDAMIVADSAGIIRLWNTGAEELFGHTADETIGQTMDMIIPENLRARHWTGYHETMRTGHTKYGRGEMLAVPAIRKDGSRISIEFSIALLRDEAGTITNVVAIMRDVTPRWQQDRELRKRLAELEAAVKKAAPA
jgi:PAS domain S-box-containing protein